MLRTVSFCTEQSLFFLKLSPFFKIHSQKTDFPKGFLIFENDFFKKGDKIKKIMHHFRERSDIVQVCRNKIYEAYDTIIYSCIDKLQLMKKLLLVFIRVLTKVNKDFYYQFSIYILWHTIA